MERKFKHETVWESGWVFGYRFSVIKLVNPFTGENTGWQSGYVTNTHGNAQVEFFSTVREAYEHIINVSAKTNSKVDTKPMMKYVLLHDEAFKAEMISFAGEELVNSFLGE